MLNRRALPAIVTAALMAATCGAIGFVPAPRTPRRTPRPAGMAAMFSRNALRRDARLARAERLRTGGAA